MGTNGTDGAIHLMLEEQRFGIERITESQDQVETGHDFTFEPLVNRIAFGIARELASAVKQLEHHIGGEAGKLAEAVERRLDSIYRVGIGGDGRSHRADRSTGVASGDRVE